MYNTQCVLIYVYARLLVVNVDNTNSDKRLMYDNNNKPSLTEHKPSQHYIFSSTSYSSSKQFSKNSLSKLRTNFDVDLVSLGKVNRKQTINDNCLMKKN